MEGEDNKRARRGKESSVSAPPAGRVERVLKGRGWDLEGNPPALPALLPSPPSGVTRTRGMLHGWLELGGGWGGALIGGGKVGRWEGLSAGEY